MVSATRQALGALLVLALIVTPTIVQNSRAAPVSVTVGSSTVSITMTLQLLENFTDLPQGRFLVDGSNSTLIQQLERPMDTAMQRLVPSARVRDITLQAVIGNLSSQLSMIEENYTFVVDGASSYTGGLVNFNLALLSMSDTNSTYLQVEQHVRAPRFFIEMELQRDALQSDGSTPHSRGAALPPGRSLLSVIAGSRCSCQSMGPRIPPLLQCLHSDRLCHAADRQCGARHRNWVVCDR